MSYFIRKKLLRQRRAKAEPEIDYSSLADELDYDQLSDELDYAQLANELDYDDIASEIDQGELIGRVDYSELIDHICYSSLSFEIDYGDLYEQIEIDYDNLSQYVDLECLSGCLAGNSTIHECVAERIEVAHIAEHVQDPWSMMVAPFSNGDSK